MNEPSLVVLRRVPGCSFSTASIVPVKNRIVELSELLAAADCDLLEALDWHCSNRLRGHAWLNEEGKLRQPWVVSGLITEGNRRVHDAIVGPVAFSGGIDQEGETLALDRAQAIELADAINQDRPIIVMRGLTLRVTHLPA